MKKVVLKLDLFDHNAKRKSLQIVAGLSGVDSMWMEMKDKKLTVMGDVDPIELVYNLRKKLCHTEVLTVGPAKEEEKKKKDEEDNKDIDEDKDEDKDRDKDRGNDKDKKQDDNKKDGNKGFKYDPHQLFPQFDRYYPPPYMSYNPQQFVRSFEEDPNSRVPLIFVN